MLIRRSTFTFVLVGALVFLVGGSFVLYQRPEYLPSGDIIPQKWRDWSGLSPSSDRPLPGGAPSSNDKTQNGNKPPDRRPGADKEHEVPGDDGMMHALPIDEVKPLPVSSENVVARPIDIKSSPELKEHLLALLGAPMPSYSQSIKESVKSCPSEIADVQVNPDQHAGNLEKWTTMDRGQLLRRRLAIVEYLEGLEKDGQALVGKLGKSGGKGRGIVMTGGNKDTTQRLLVTLRILRREYSSTLPVEVFSFPGEITEQVVINELLDLGATIHELPGRQKLNTWKNFQIKAEAILSSSFQEILYLDSDNVPLRDPAYLFEAPLYAKQGQPRAVFWPDLNKDHPDNPIWRLMGKKCDYSEWELDSGQILIDKMGNGGLNLAAIHVAMHMQLEHEFYFSLSGGDKDTFRYAFWALQLPYSVSPRWLSSLGFHNPLDNGKFCGVAMLQYDIVEPPRQSRTHPLPLFVHANLLKHLSDSIIPTSAFATIKRASDDVAASRALDGVRGFVHTTHGMCIDFELIQEGAGGKGEGESIVEEKFEEAYDGTFKRWAEDVYAKHGGKKGGW